MKTKICILSLCLVALGAQAQKTTKNWERIGSLGNTQHFYNKVYAFGKDSVFIIGNMGLVARSTDGAISWKRQHPCDKELRDILFINSKTGFAIGREGMILRTENGGDSWQLLNPGVSVDFKTIQSDGKQQLWICGPDKLLLYSPDKGNNWISKTFPGRIFCYYGKRCYSASSNQVWVSEDSGNNWQDITAKLPGHGGDYGFMKFQVARDRLYFLCIKGNELHIFQCETHPHWTKATSSLDRIGIDMTGLSDVLFRMPGNAYIISHVITLCGGGAPTRIHKTEDAGRTWREDNQNTRMGEGSANLSFPVEGLGYALSRTNLYRSPYTGKFENLGNDDSGLREPSFRPRMQRRGGSLLISAPEALQRLRIGSLEGHALRDLPLQGKEAEISLDGLPQGIYILSLETRSGARYNCKWIW